MIRTRLDPDRNSLMITSLSFWSMSPCSYQGRNCEVPGMHFLCEPVPFALCIEKNNSLCNCQCLIQVTKCIQLPFLSFNIKIKLIPSRVNSSFFTKIGIGSLMNFLVTSNTSAGIVAESNTTRILVFNFLKIS